MISLSQTYGEDAEEVKTALLLFSSPGKRDAEIVSIGKRIEGMRIATDHANSLCDGWSRMAFEALKEFIKHHRGTFTTKQVRDWAVQIPTMKAAAWGSVVSSAKKAGLIKQAGWVDTDDASPHARQSIQWIAV